MSSSGGSRVSIPENVRQIIGEIKQIAGEHSDDDVYTMLKECNMDPNATTDQLLYIDTFHVVQRRRNRKVLNESCRAYEENKQAPSMPGREARGSRRNYTSSHVSDDARGGGHVTGRNVVIGRSVKNGRNLNVQKDNGFINHTEEVSTPARPVVKKTGNNATPRATNSTLSENGPKRFSNRTATHGPVRQPHSSAGTNSSSSDPILVESAGQGVTESHKSTSDFVQSSDKVEVGVPQVVGEGQLSEISQSLVLSTHEQQSGSSEVVVPETVGTLEALPANSLVDSANSDLDTQLEKLTISSSQSVIFPELIHIPEAFKNQLMFGSLDEAFGGEETNPVVESVREIGDGAGESSLSSQSVSTAQEGAITVHPQGDHMPQNLSTLGDSVVSGSALNKDMSNQEIMSSLGGTPFPLLQPVPNYSFGLVPPITGSHAALLDGTELQGLNSMASSVSGATTPAAHPLGVRQSSLAVLPHLFPLYRPAYSPNYIPYNPYLSHIYMPQNPQVLGHNGFPLPPSNGNVYIPPAAAAASAASGVKFPLPPPYKPGTNAGLSPMGIPSGYASYGSTVGFSPNSAITPGSSACPEELSASELKEKNLFSVVRQGEDSHAWTTTFVAGPDMSSLQNYFYSLPQGQHIGFSPAQANHGPFAGVYHPSQTMAAPPSSQHLHQSQAMTGSIESGLPPPAAYQHPQHAQMNWNSQLLGRENIH